MKNLQYIISLALLFILVGCSEEDKVIYEGQLVSISGPGVVSIDEAAGEQTVSITISKAPSSDLTLNLQVEEGSAVEGEDFNLQSTVVIPSGEYSGSFTYTLVDNSEVDGAKTFTISLSETSDFELSKQSSLEVTIIDDDCPVPELVGEFQVTTTNTSPAGCDGVTNSVTISKVSDNPDGSTTYLLSDVTGGLYANCYGSADNPGEIVVDGLSVTLTAQPDVVYGGDQFDGTGSINTCDEVLTLNWSNGFGDSGSTAFQL
ncbi:Calx-beta domain-containing protein [Ekhidna sp.]|uniref:Calx-beta domain-containing protein n=1 Tax=Ekhidna sp. TaxID=2608089 RepID=UPI003B597879